MPANREDMHRTPTGLPPRNTILLTLCGGALLLIALYVRLRLLSTPLERDEGEYAYMGQLLLKGIAPYSHAYTMKLPGVALCYALFMAIFGQTTTGIHAGLLGINLLSAFLVYRVGRTLFNRETAVAAAGLYALLSVGMPLLGIFAHATHFVVLFSLAGMVVLQEGLGKRRAPLVFVSGLCFGLAVLMKQHAVIMIPFALWCQIRFRAKAAHAPFVKDGLVLLLGTALPCGAVAVWLLLAGVFPEFWFWTVQYAGAYAGENSLATGLNAFVSQFSPILRHQLPVWVLAGAGLAGLRARQDQRQAWIVLAGFLVSSFIMICPGLYFRPHYFILLLPPISLLAACGATAAAGLPRVPERYRLLLPALLLVAASAYCLLAERRYLFSAPPLEVSRSIYGTNPFPEAIPIADYIRSHTTPRERVAILGSEPEILFYADRLSATGHIYMYGLMEKHRYAEQMQAQVIREIESAQPAFIVVVNNPASWLLRPDSLNRILEWGDGYIALRYDEVGIIDIHGDRPTDYLWDNAVAGKNPGAGSFVSVYRRRW